MTSFLLQCKPNTLPEKGGASTHEYLRECTVKRLQQKKVFFSGPLNEHFCKSFVCNEIAVNVNFHFFPHYKLKSMATISCHSNQSFYQIGTKTIVFVPHAYSCYVWNLVMISFMASEQMLFENVDRWWTDNGCLPIFQLRWANNICKTLTEKLKKRKILYLVTVRQSPNIQKVIKAWSRRQKQLSSARPSILIES